MNTHTDKTQENKSQAVVSAVSQKQSGAESTFQFVDNRPEAVAQRKLQEMANNSPQVSQLIAFQEIAYNTPQGKRAAQLQQVDQGSVIQRAVSEERIVALIQQASEQVGWSDATYETVHPVFILLLRAEDGYAVDDEEVAARLFLDWYEPTEEKQKEVEPEVDPYSQIMVLEVGTSIDFPALTRVMDDVVIGVRVSSNEWRAMRAKLSSAIQIKNKSHSDHGSNFDDPQRPEQQIVDWANVIGGELKEKLSEYFVAKHGIYL